MISPLPPADLDDWADRLHTALLDAHRLPR